MKAWFFACGASYLWAQNIDPFGHRVEDGSLEMLVGASRCAAAQIAGRSASCTAAHRTDFGAAESGGCAARGFDLTVLQRDNKGGGFACHCP